MGLGLGLEWVRGVGLHVDAIAHFSFFARSAKLPIELYILPSEISSFLNRPIISHHLLGQFSRSFLLYERYLREFSRSGPIFPIPQRRLPWQPIFGKICEMTVIQQAAISKRIRLSQFRFKKI